jgi:hypothetical protein
VPEYEMRLSRHEQGAVYELDRRELRGLRLRLRGACKTAASAGFRFQCSGFWKTQHRVVIPDTRNLTPEHSACKTGFCKSLACHKTFTFLSHPRHHPPSVLFYLCAVTHHQGRFVVAPSGAFPVMHRTAEKPKRKEATGNR